MLSVKRTYFDCVEPPSLDVVTELDGHPHEAVEGDAHQLVFLLAVEPDDEERDAVVRQRLPRLDEVHLRLHQVQVLDVGMRFQDFLTQLKWKICLEKKIRPKELNLVSFI